MLVVWYALSNGWITLPTASVVNTYEGPHHDLYGFQPAGQGTVFAANDPNPCSGLGGCGFVSSTGSLGGFAQGAYSWNYAPTVTTITKQRGPTTVRITTNIVPHNDPITGTNFIKPISYKVPLSETLTIKVPGGIYLYDAQTVVSVVSGSSLVGDNTVHFQNDVLWLRLWSNTWNRYYPVSSIEGLPNGTLLGAWSAPIAMSLISGQELTQAPSPTNDQTSPDWHLSNQPITLFNIPQTTSQIPLGLANANQTLAGTNPLSPDSTMTEYAYFPISLTNVGAFGYNCITFSCTEGDPIIQFNFQVYYLQIQQYLFVNPFTKPITCGSQGCGGTNVGFFDGLYAFVSSPLTWLGIAGLGAVGVLILLAIYASPLLVALVYYFASRKKGGGMK